MFRPLVADVDLERKRICVVIADELEPLFVTMTDFLSAIPNVQPSAKIEGFATVPGGRVAKIPLGKGEN